MIIPNDLDVFDDTREATTQEKQQRQQEVSCVQNLLS